MDAEEAKSELLNPYMNGVAHENWKRGFLGLGFIGYPGSVAEKFYKEGKKAAAATCSQKAKDR